MKKLVVLFLIIFISLSAFSQRLIEFKPMYLLHEVEMSSADTAVTMVFPMNVDDMSIQSICDSVQDSLYIKFYVSNIANSGWVEYDTNARILIIPTDTIVSQAMEFDNIKFTYGKVDAELVSADSTKGKVSVLIHLTPKFK